MATSNNGKLFASEDFDKNYIPEKSPKKPWWPWLLAGALVCGVIIFLMTRGKGDTKDILEQPKEQIVEDVPAQDVPNVAEQESKENGTGQATPKTQAPPTTVQNNAPASRNVTKTEANGTIEEEAWRTIRGNYGNGADRKEVLGSRYEEIQAKVNDFYREGKVN